MNDGWPPGVWSLEKARDNLGELGFFQHVCARARALNTHTPLGREEVLKVERLPMANDVISHVYYIRNLPNPK